MTPPANKDANKDTRISVASRFALSLLSSYKLLISPLLGNRCRFHPSCADYCRQAIEGHGLLHGSLMGAKRLCRCHPLCEGGLDPIPQQELKETN